MNAPDHADRANGLVEVVDDLHNERQLIRLRFWN